MSDVREDHPHSGEKRTATNDTTTNTKKQAVQRSDVWNHFTKLVDDPHRCKCHYCGLTFKCAPTSGTSTLRNHTTICKAYTSLTEAEKQKKLAFKQDGAGNSLAAVRYCPLACRAALGKMIVLDELPFSFIEKIGFKNFCATAIPDFDIPSRRSITRDIVEVYSNEKVVLRSFFMAYKQRVCLATDIWTAPTTSVSYMVVTAHFIDVNWCLHRKIINFKPISNHKGETIGNQLVRCLTDWGIQKVFTVTVDNASANDSGIRHLKNNVNFSGDESLILGGEFMHIRCAAHNLNLIVRDGLARMNKSVVAIRNAVKYVRSSDQRFNSFHMRLGLEKSFSRGSLTMDCQTRWNSTYLMLDNALKYRYTFDKLAFEDRPYDTYFQGEDNGEKRLGPPTYVDWDDVTRLVDFLKFNYVDWDDVY